MLYIPKSWYINPRNEEAVQTLFSKYCKGDILSDNHVNEQALIEADLREMGEKTILEYYQNGKISY